MSQTPIEYIRTLITEKGVDPTVDVPVFTEAGHIGLSYDVFLAFLGNQISAEMQENVRQKLIKLDFNNADVFDYLHHQMNAMIIETGMSEYAGVVKTKYGEFVAR